MYVFFLNKNSNNNRLMINSNPDGCDSTFNNWSGLGCGSEGAVRPLYWCDWIIRTRKRAVWQRTSDYIHSLSAVMEAFAMMYWRTGRTAETVKISARNGLRSWVFDLQHTTLSILYYTCSSLYKIKVHYTVLYSCTLYTVINDCYTICTVFIKVKFNSLFVLMGKFQAENITNVQLLALFLLLLVRHTYL